MADTDHTLDITGYVCPMTFVKTTLFLESMKPGETVAVRLNAGEPLENVPRAARERGHEVLSLAPESADQTPGQTSGQGASVYVVVLRKGAG